MFQGSLTMPVGAPVAKPHPVSMPRYVRANMKTESMWPSTFDSLGVEVPYPT